MRWIATQKERKNGRASAEHGDKTHLKAEGLKRKKSKIQSN